MTEFAFPATITSGRGLATVTAFNVNADEPVFVATENHPHWDGIIEGLRTGDENVWELFDVAAGVLRRFNQVTDRISWDGENVLFDGDPIHSVLADQLARALEDGHPENYTALAKFWEKLESNPTEHSRQQAFDWLACHKFQITPEGDVVGYKGVNDLGDGKYESGWASRVPDVPSAFVNGVPVPPLSRVPQEVGDVVTMPRSEVVHNPRQACERGLHVATRDYAGSYGTVLEVHVNPRDIVSVPTDGGGAKVRACRYVVARVAVDNAGTGPVLRDSKTENVWAGDVGYKV